MRSHSSPRLVMWLLALFTCGRWLLVCPLEAPMGAASSTCFFVQAKVWWSSFKGLSSGRLKSESTFHRAHCVSELATSSRKSETSICGHTVRSLRTGTVSWWVIPLFFWHIAGRQEMFSFSYPDRRCKLTFPYLYIRLLLFFLGLRLLEYLGTYHPFSLKPRYLHRSLLHLCLCSYCIISETWNLSRPSDKLI